jgi:bifunctional UDP-N-acetylglucosamine pyrophosphorylase / glucosamine-1-phosphate N-acetyltransferase
MRISTLILAAGQGTRMVSTLPKVMHTLAGKPLIRHAVQTAQAVSEEKPVVVIGHGSEQVQNVLGDEVEFVLQQEQLGTAHAVMAAEPTLRAKGGIVLVFYADMPLLTAKTLQALADANPSSQAPVTMLTVELDDPHGFGRVVRDRAGKVLKIVEDVQTTPEQRKIRELNAGVYCFDATWLWDALHKIRLSPKGEYYLTDVVEVATSSGLEVKAIRLEDPEELVGINNRVHLAEAEEIMRRRINTAWMLQGVTMLNPEACYIEADVKIGKDTVIFPNTFLRGKTTIGENCLIGTNSIIENCQIGNGCKVIASVMEGAQMDDGSEIGPFGHLRKGAHLGEKAHMGNFGEMKNSYLGAHSKMGHFSYIGDAQIGEDVNIGAGTITCNYDGLRKNRTEIGAGAFIGSDTMLVAPVKIGAGARTGAGAVVTHDVPPDTVVVGVPAHPLKKDKEKVDH